jgi:hypothetical protein
MAQRREARLCYNCPAKYSKEHIKECSMNGIYLLEINDDAPTDDTDEELRISVNAITGISTWATMHLGVTVANTAARALVDSCSTHYFLADTMVQRLGLTLLPQPGLSVGVANGDRVACTGLCHDVPVQIAGEQFLIDFYVLPLGGYEVVLGCQWLRTLGPILWDLDRLSMSFWRVDHRVHWRGLDAPTATPSAPSITVP